MSKKGENIRKRKDGRWEGRYKRGRKENGEILYGSVYGKTYREVKEKMRVAMVAPKDVNPPNVSAEMTFAILLHKWQESNEIRLKGGTKTRYENLINTHIIPELGGLKLSDINATTINGFLNDKLMKGRLDGSGGLSPSYVRSISLVITSALNYAVTEGYMQAFKNKINKPNITKSELPILSLENQKVLEQHIKSELTPTSIGILISLYTGLRIGEICALCWNDINLNTRTIYVRHTVSRIKSAGGDNKTELILDEPKTASSKRVVPIPSPLFYALVDFRKDATSLYVVSSTDSFVSPRTYDARFHRILNDCNLEDLNYHGLRHTFATRCIEAGVDVKSLSEILGHANVSITLNTYVHSSLEMKKSQLEKLTLLSV